MARFYYSVVTSGPNWEVKFEGQTDRFVYATQQAAIDVATDTARRNWEAGIPSGVRIQGADARWRDERTYGNDPFPPRG